MTKNSQSLYSIRALMKKPEVELSEFEKKVFNSQKKAFQAKKDLEQKVGETSFGVEIDGPYYPKLTEEQKKVEFESFFYGIRALSDALLYLTDNRNTELNFWQYQELFNFVKENYPQTMYGHEDIHKGSFYLHSKFKKVIEEINIPLSEEVRKIVYEGYSDEFNAMIQGYYMSRFSVDEHEAKEMVDHTKFSSYTFSSDDPPEKIQDIYDDIQRKKEWDDFITGNDEDQNI